jgi:hypothetical protein
VPAHTRVVKGVTQPVKAHTKMVGTWYMVIWFFLFFSLLTLIFFSPRGVQILERLGLADHLRFKVEGASLILQEHEAGQRRHKMKKANARCKLEADFAEAAALELATASAVACGATLELPTQPQPAPAVVPDATPKPLQTRRTRKRG